MSVVVVPIFLVKKSANSDSSFFGSYIYIEVNSIVCEPYPSSIKG